MQALWVGNHQVGAAVFYAPGKITFPDLGSVEADLPCILLITKKEKVGPLSVCDPTPTQSKLILEIPQAAKTRWEIDLPGGEKAGGRVQMQMG